MSSWEAPRVTEVPRLTGCDHTDDNLPAGGWQRFLAILTYNGCATDEVINYVALAIVLLPFVMDSFLCPPRSVQVRVRRHCQLMWAPFLVFASAFQIGLCFVENCTGISVVWNMLAGYQCIVMLFPAVPQSLQVLGGASPLGPRGSVGATAPAEMKQPASALSDAGAGGPSAGGAPKRRASPRSAAGQEKKNDPSSCSSARGADNHAMRPAAGMLPPAVEMQRKVVTFFVLVSLFACLGVDVYYMATAPLLTTVAHLAAILVGLVVGVAKRWWVRRQWGNESYRVVATASSLPPPARLGGDRGRGDGLREKEPLLGDRSGDK